eukprot:TRINITY_DN5530_c1_g1_i1.p1 TRINITY_DN5530_c1_g1~~TRINITY_DN5530_c1_g1_i1.p1  ORF type:complete len:481 (-),score=107.34 TRINITY_DN5530_c1_g1_i1:106-1548(-)
MTSRLALSSLVLKDVPSRVCQPLKRPCIEDSNFLFPPGYSKYKSEFQELDTLGKGGFGSVVRAKNISDGRLYAIKKVPLPRIIPSSILLGQVKSDVDLSMCFKELREPSIMSSLSHQNIVGYHKAWMESNEDNTSPTPSLIPPIHRTQTNHDKNNQSFVEIRKYSTFENQTNKYNNNNKNKTTRNNEDYSSLHRKNHNFTYTKYQEENSSESLGSSLDESDNSLESKESSLEPKMTLFIQMQLCGSETLKDWINNNPSRLNNYNNNNNNNFSIVHNIIFQITKGLDHIHKNNIIHRDLKPANIFINHNSDNNNSPINIKIGDFGLSTESPTKNNNNNNSIQFSNTTLSILTSKDDQSINGDDDDDVEDAVDDGEDGLTSGVGTVLYASPEQLQKHDYDEKTDIYSLGIVMFELFHPFKTSMERMKTITSLRSIDRTLPQKFRSLYPVESELITEMSSHNSVERPSTDLILHHRMFDHFQT